MRIAVIGSGYVGLSLACLFGIKNDVTVVDIDSARIDQVNSGVSPIVDPEIENALARGELRIRATACLEEACANAEYAIISTPTDYVNDEGRFDTSSIDSTIDALDAMNATCCIVIKSTVPIGYTKRMALAYPRLNILFSPEFLREGRALYDNLHPSRIIVGVPGRCEELQDLASRFANLLHEAADEDAEKLITGSSEAESVKLFSNTYLAMRIAFFNEVDTFAETVGLDAGELVRGICLDSRIGGFYNNPSFGYGGYCLPKDSKQLLANYKDIPQELVRAVVAANRTRKDYIADRIERLATSRAGESVSSPVVGIYRLIMKRGSDNFRHSSVQGIMKRLNKRGIKMVVYEPLLNDDCFYGVRVVHDLEEFKRASDLIVANRWEDLLDDVRDKVYTRDLFNRD